jgi:hypothetical protein
MTALRLPLFKVKELRGPARTRNPQPEAATQNFAVAWIPGSPRSLSSGRPAVGPVGGAPE